MAAFKKQICHVKRGGKKAFSSKEQRGIFLITDLHRLLRPAVSWLCIIKHQLIRAEGRVKTHQREDLGAFKEICHEELGRGRRRA